MLSDVDDEHRLLDESATSVDQDKRGSVDVVLAAAGGFGRAQLKIMAVALAAWVVHGAQVMSMAFVAPAAAAEFASEATAVKMTGSFFFLGWLLGLSLWGRLASQRGWLFALVCIEVCVGVSGCATAWAASGKQYLLTRFLCGFSEGGVPTTSYGWAGEFLLPAHKPRAGIALQVGFQCGSMLLTLAAAHAGSSQWRALSLLVSAMAFPVALLAYLVPESPRWLRRAGHHARATQTLRWVAATNGRPRAVGAPAIELVASATADEPREDETAANGRPRTRCSPPLLGIDGGASEGEREAAGAPSAERRRLWAGKEGGGLPPAADETRMANRRCPPRARVPPSLFRLIAAEPSLRRVISILCLQWMVYASVFFGLSLHEAQHISVSGILVANTCQIPAIVATALSFDRYGRRTTMLVLLTVASLACAALALLAAGLHAPHGARQAVSTLGMAAISSAFAGGYVLSSELLPTDVRALGLSLCSQCARFGGFFSPLALLLDQPAVPYALWAALALTAGLSALWLPETLGEPSLESMRDLHELMARSLTVRFG